MNIAYVITRADSVGGATVHVRDLARAMLERGHRATVLVGGRGPVTDQFTQAGIPFRSLRFLERRIHPVRDLRAIAEMISVLGELRPDLVSTHTAKAGWIGRAACARLRIPVLYTPHGWSIGRRVSAPLGAVFTLAETAAAHWSSAIVCVCEAERRLALARRVAPAGKLFVVHNGVRDVDCRRTADPALSPPRICSIARFETPKDHRTLLRALAALRSAAWELDLIGDGPLEAEIRKLAAGLGLAARVRFLGYQADPAPALARAQLFVLSSRSEGFPRSVLEAMRAGLPVVASDVGGVSESVTEGVNGLLVPRRDPAALAAALAKLLADPALRQRMGAASRAAFETRFRWESMVDHTAAIYATVVGLGKSGDKPRVRSGLLSTRARVFKRVLDIVSAFALAVLALPFALVIALAIVLETRGPVFFVHTRIGKGGRRFGLWKFRSMVEDANTVLDQHLRQHPDLLSEWTTTHKLKDDPRVTRVGRLLRRSSLDELPQLWNVLRGDMSMIGPRPIVEEEIPKYGPVYALYSQVVPGLTGLWQVSGRNDTSYRRRTELDSEYIQDWTMWKDLVVLVKTVRVVLFGHGAY